MSGSMISVTYNALSQAGGNTTNAQSSLVALNETVTKAVNQFSGVWTGVAYDQFEGFYAQYSQAANDLQDALGRLAAALHNAVEDYSRGDTDVSKIWAG